MSGVVGIPTISSPSGKDRWTQSVAVERIICEMRFLVLKATDKPRDLPEFYDWARDLRRGRTNVMGGYFRLVDAIKRREMGYAGRMLALGLLELAQQYVDIQLPASPTPTPPAMAEPTPVGRPRLYRPIVARGAVVMRKAA